MIINYIFFLANCLYLLINMLYILLQYILNILSILQIIRFRLLWAITFISGPLCCHILCNCSNSCSFSRISNKGRIYCQIISKHIFFLEVFFAKLRCPSSFQPIIHRLHPLRQPRLPFWYSLFRITRIIGRNRVKIGRLSSLSSILFRHLTLSKCLLVIL